MSLVINRLVLPFPSWSAGLFVLALLLLGTATNSYAHYDETATTESYYYEMAIDPTYTDVFPVEVTLDVTFYLKAGRTIIKDVGYQVELTAPDGSRINVQDTVATGLAHVKYIVKAEGEHVAKVVIASIQGKTVKPEPATVKFPITGPPTPQKTTTTTTTTTAPTQTQTQTTTQTTTTPSSPTQTSPASNPIYTTETIILAASSSAFVVIAIAVFAVFRRRRPSQP